MKNKVRALRGLAVMAGCGLPLLVGGALERLTRVVSTPGCEPGCREG